jgi:hypothetical protein
MPAPDEIHRDLPSDLERSESEALVAAALQLQAKTPTPTPSFRVDLRRRLLETTEDRLAPQTTSRSVGLLALSYGAAGMFLLAIAAAGLVGTGPFASG